ncbi:MAG: glucan 1,4-alpha-glucosidase [Actinobacteria bacterium]|nr:glucan 1,4-alpha-glucosidase [Actinomycetota bacterium]
MDWPKYGFTPLVAALGAVALILTGCSSSSTSESTNDRSAAKDDDVVATASLPDAPGVSSYYGLGRKDCVGTAQNTTSKVWYTVANGVLSDVYGATVDITNLQSLQYIVTDGSTFTDVQSNADDMTYTASVDSTGMQCTVVSSSVNHGYTLTTKYITDPDTNTVLMNTTLGGSSSGLKVYVRMNSSVNGNGGGGDTSSGGNMGGDTATIDSSGALVSYDTNTSIAAVNASYLTPQYLALQSSPAFTSSTQTNGYANPTPASGSSSSDPLAALQSNFSYTPQTTDAGPGNVAQAAEINTSNGSWTLALSLDTSQSNAVSDATAALKGSFSSTASDYTGTWDSYDNGLNSPPSSLPGVSTADMSRIQTMYYQSLNTVKAAEDKTFPGALAAGLAAPWGQSVPAGQNQASNNGDPSWSSISDGYAPYFGSYKEIFARDASEAATALLYAGDQSTAQNVASFLLQTQVLSTGQIPRNSLPNGQPAPDSGATQMDESAFPILLAYQSGLYKNNASLYKKSIIPTADWIIANGPEGTGSNCWSVSCSIGVERWEEQTGFSPSTIAAEIAGLTAASAIASANGDATHAQHYQAAADNFQNYLADETVNTDPGEVADADFSSAGSGYYLRVGKTTPTANFNYSLGNGITAEQDQLNVIDPGFLEMVRLGALPADNDYITQTLGLITGGDVGVQVSLTNGTGYHRYGTGSPNPEDGYGDCIAGGNSSCSTTGAPWAPTGTGIGHAWPLLNGEHGEYDVAAGNYPDAGGELTNMMNFAVSSGGLLPEQVWVGDDLAASPWGSDPATASIGFTQGRPAGSAMPLTWATAQFARLVYNLAAEKNLETPGIVTKRYPGGEAPIMSTFSVSSPTGGGGSNGCSSSTSGGGTITVTGTAAPGATIVVENFAKATGGAATTETTTADSSTGAFSVAIATASNSTLSTSAESESSTALSIIGLC